MRLLNVFTKKLQTFYTDCPSYAILSHTWLEDHEEVTYTQIQQLEACTHMKGYRKIQFTCEQAISDGYEWVWIDTCCIDKTSSAELSEAINSMFNWYKDAQVCYAYLVDIDVQSEEPKDFRTSRWWSRSWTLQEFLVPSNLLFFDMNWQELGTKKDSASRISEAIGISEDVILSPNSIFNASVATRMSWAARRTAKRTEDLAYALIGIFRINMPLLYGEGSKAFLRLQREILETTGDQSLFAWNFIASQTIGQDTSSVQLHESSIEFQHSGMFALHPAQFSNSNSILFFRECAQCTEFRIFNGCLKMKIPLIQSDMRHRQFVRQGGWPLDNYIGMLPCGYPGKEGYLLGILLNCASGSDIYTRLHARQVDDQYQHEAQNTDQYGTAMVHIKDAIKAQTREIIIQESAPIAAEHALSVSIPTRFSLVLETIAVDPELRFFDSLPHKWKWDATGTTLLFPQLTHLIEKHIVVAWYHAREQYLLCATIYFSQNLTYQVAISLRRELVQIAEASTILSDCYADPLPSSSECAPRGQAKDRAGGYVATVSGKELFEYVSYTLTVEGAALQLPSAQNVFSWLKWK